MQVSFWMMNPKDLFWMQPDIIFPGRFFFSVFFLDELKVGLACKSSIKPVT